MKETTKKFFLSLLTALVSGIFIGVIVGIYQLLLQYVVEFPRICIRRQLGIYCF